MARALCGCLILSLSLAAEGRRCLDESRAPLLRYPNIRTIVLEEGTWDSARILANILRILLEEFLGYDVVMNSVGSSNGAVRRAALPVEPGGWLETDGEKLKEMLDSGADFAYVAPEAWNLGQQADLVKKYFVENEYTRIAGGVGFDGRVGWYAPRALSEPPLGFEFYQAFRPGRLNATLGPGTRSLPTDCSGHASCTCCRNCNGSCGCCQVPSEECDSWCPGYLEEIPSLPPLPLLKPRAYDVGLAEAIILNNKFHMAVKLTDSGDDSYRREVGELVNASGMPILFYSWMPDLLPLSLDVVRVFLPQGDCGERGGSDVLGTWKCDYVPEGVQKLASRSLPLRAPLAWQLISAFEVKLGEHPAAGSFSDSSGVGIIHMLKHLEYLRSLGEAGAPDDALVEEVACQYVRDNLRTWEESVTRPFPRWAEVSDPWVVMSSITLIIGALALTTCVWERFFVQSGLCGKYGKYDNGLCPCCSRCMRRCRRQHAHHPSDDHCQPHNKPSWVTKEATGALDRFVHGSSLNLSGFADAGSEPDAGCQLDWATPELRVSAPGQVQLRIRRTGDLSGASAVRIRAFDCDAEANKHYVLHGKECVFEPDQDEASVCVDVYTVPAFGQHYVCPASFYLELVDAKGASLSRPGFKVSVTIEGSGDFLDVEALASPETFVMRFVKVLSQKNPRQFCLAVFCCAYSGFHDVVVMTLTVQLLVDWVYVDEMFELIPVVMGITLVSVLIDRWTQRSFVTLSDAGPISKQLRNIIFRKFWHRSMLDHMEEKHRAKWVVTMSRVGEATVAWVTVFRLIAELAALVFSWLVLVIVTTQWFTESIGHNEVTYCAVIGLPLTGAIGYTIIVYSGRSTHMASVVHEAETDLDRLEGQFLWSLRNWSLLVSHVPRIPVVEALRLNFLESNGSYTRALKRANLTETTSLWINEYITQMIMVFIFYHSILTVVDNKHYGQGSLTIGGFYAVIKVVRSSGNAIWKLQQLLLSFARSGEMLRSIASLLDEQDLVPPGASGQSCTGSEDDGSGAKGVRCQVQAQRSVLLKNVSFKFRHGTAVLENCSVEIPLGFSYVVDGPPRVGKQTLMRLLLGEGSMATAKGEIILPCGTRTSFVNGRAELIPGLGLLGNILLGFAGPRSMLDWRTVVELLSAALLPSSGLLLRRASSFPTRGSHHSHVGPDDPQEAITTTPPTSTSLTSQMQTNGSQGDAVNQAAEMESLSHLLARHEREQSEHGMTDRELCMVVVIRALVRDPDLLLVNVRSAPDDVWMSRVFLVLNIWRMSGGLRGLMKELDAACIASEGDAAKDGANGEGSESRITEAALRARLDSLRQKSKAPAGVAGGGGAPDELEQRTASAAAGGGGGGAAVDKPTSRRTLIVLPHSVPRLRSCEEDFGFSQVLHLVDSSTCRVEPLRVN